MNQLPLSHNSQRDSWGKLLAQRAHIVAEGRSIPDADVLTPASRGRGETRVAEAMVNAVKAIDLRWVRVEIALLVGALVMGA